METRFSTTDIAIGVVIFATVAAAVPLCNGFRKVKAKLALHSVAAFLLALFGLAAPHVVSASEGEATAYAETAFSFVSRSAYERKRVDWPKLRAQYDDMLATANTPADTYPAIRWLLSQLHDGNHSGLRVPTAGSPGGLPGSTPLHAQTLSVGDARIAQIGIPGFTDLDPLVVEDFARSIEGALVALGQRAPCGWIVDLRGNQGGNMWPMLAGLSPFLGETTVGYFLDAEGQRTAWRVSRGAAALGEATLVSLADPAALNLADAPVAVLIGPRTASAGEAVAVAFRGRANTRLFGDRTAQVSSGNIAKVMPDGAVIGVTAAAFVDRAGRVYGVTEGIGPDDDRTAGVDAAAAATGWLRERCAVR